MIYFPIGLVLGKTKIYIDKILIISFFQNTLSQQENEKRKDVFECNRKWLYSLKGLLCRECFRIIPNNIFKHFVFTSYLEVLNSIEKHIQCQ